MGTAGLTPGARLCVDDLPARRTGEAPCGCFHHLRPAMAMTDDERLAAAREELEADAGVTRISADGINAGYDPEAADKILSKGERRSARRQRKRPVISTIDLSDAF